MDYLKAEQLQLIILTGAIVAIIARRLKIPYTVGLVVAGVLLTFLRLQPGVGFSKDLLFDILLPPLIFEAALYIRWKELKRDLPIIATFATLGVLLSASVTTLIMHYAAGWDIVPSLLFGVLIAATDPVAVIATFKEAKVTGRMRLLVEAESLFNDGTAAVAFAIALAFAATGDLNLPSSLLKVAVAIGGGILAGLLVGGGSYLIIWRTKDHLVELSMTSVAAFGSFWLAEHFHLSGILAATTAGLLIGNLSSFGTVTEKGEESIEHFWEFAAFVANSVIFLLLGVNAVYQDLLRSFGPILIAIAAVLIGRAAAVYPCAAIFSWSSLKLKPRHKHVMFWGGLRGALALALALTIPEDAPYRTEILAVTFGVVAFSVIIQGTTISWLLGWLKEDKMRSERAELLEND